MVPGRLVYCRPGSQDWDVSPVFGGSKDVLRTAATSIKLSSGGTLATIFGRKHDIHLITPMTKLAILEYPDPRLRTKAAPVTAVDDAVRQLVGRPARDHVCRQGRRARGEPGGRAPAAPGARRERRRAISRWCSSIRRSSRPRDRAPGEEGCLSLPGIYDKLERAARIRVRALDRNGEPFEFEAEGMLAVCIQHEMDHLEGKLFVDYLSELKRQLIRRRLQKERRQRPRRGARSALRPRALRSLSIS